MTTGPTIERPPLFVSVFDAHSVAHSGIIDDQGGLDTAIRGDRYCTVHAPNGLSKRGFVNVDDTPDPYKRYLKFVALLLAKRNIRPDDLFDLWIDPGTGREQTPTAGFDGAALAAWASGSCLIPHQWTASWEPIGSSHVLAISSKGPSIDHVQLWTDAGPSIIARIPSVGTLIIALSQGIAGTVLRPLVVGDMTTAAAYWGFLRHQCTEAAAELGKQIVKSVLSESMPDSASMIAAAHYACRFGATIDIANNVITALQHRPADDSDAAAMSWMLRFDFGFDLDDKALADAFVSMIQLLQHSPPLYTETIRLLAERLSPALALLDSLGDQERMSESIGWTRRLATCIYWDSEFTAYRGVAPSRPDPKAIGENIPSAQKKNTLLL